MIFHIFLHCGKWVQRKKLVQVKLTHHKKLKCLGIDTSHKIPPDKIIFNYSKRSLTEKEKEALKFGLDFGLTPNKLNYIKYFTCFERLCNTLKNCSLYGSVPLTSIFNKVSVIANDYFIKFRKEGNSGNKEEKERIEILKYLGNERDIIITRPDKGRGIVILDKDEYNNKMDEILADISKLGIVNADIAEYVPKLEDKLNRIKINT